MSEVNEDRAMKLHLEMLACADRLERALARAPRPRDPRRGPLPCEIFIDVPYTRADCALMLRAIRAVRRQHPLPKDRVYDLPIEAVMSQLRPLRHRLKTHSVNSGYFGPSIAEVNRHLEDLTKVFWDWNDAAGYGIPF